MKNIATLKNNPLLSIAIPTWNRAPCLEKLLDSILSQIKENKGEIEICVSDNNSTDNTAEVVMGFQKKYPGLINYNKNEKNIGADANILKIMEMSQGDFVWLFGDDDFIINNGLKEVVGFVRESCRENTGLIIVSSQSYFLNKKTGEKEFYYNGFNKNKPKFFEINKKDIIGLSFPAIGFISALIFNGKLLRKILKEERKQVEEWIGTSHIQMFFSALMFLKYPDISGLAFNKEIVCQELPQYKFDIEGKFELHYRLQRKINSLLLSNKYMNDNYAPLIVQRGRKLAMEFIIDMAVMRAFKGYNYFSYFGCLKLFFQNASFIDALLFSAVFSILFLIPPIILTSMYKGLLMVKYGKKWKTKWELTSNVFYLVSMGTLRRV